jgi:hypothetical protein
MIAIKKTTALVDAIGRVLQRQARPISQLEVMRPLWSRWLISASRIIFWHTTFPS